jgi:hypothetical protein
VRIPILGQRKADSGPSDDAGHAPDGEEGQEYVAKSLEGGERKDAPELEEEGGFEEHDANVVAQRRDEDQLYMRC